MAAAALGPHQRGAQAHLGIQDHVPGFVGQAQFVRVLCPQLGDQMIPEELDQRQGCLQAVAMLDIEDIVGQHGVLQHLGHPPGAETTLALQGAVQSLFQFRHSVRADGCLACLHSIRRSATAGPGSSDSGPGQGHADGGIDGARLHVAQGVSGGIETRQAGGAVSAGGPDALGFVHRHARGGSPDLDEISSRIPLGNGRPSGMGLEL